MYKLEFTLKQHTPLIHFQHYQDGATLRATEVKPKLDRFVLTKLGKEELEKTKPDATNEEKYAKGIEIAKAKEWLIGKGEHPAFDYKLRIESNNNSPKMINSDQSNSPMYFGNMGDENPPKHLKFIAISDGSIISRNHDLCELISRHISEFFFKNNFGSRQSKGYGSFSISKYRFDLKDVIIPVVNKNWYDYYLEFNINIESGLENIYLEPFKQLDWFYRSLRSGINYKGLYFKSALFMYLYHIKNVQWDKKTIKAHYLDNPDQSLLEFSKRLEKNLPVNILYRTKQNDTYNKPDILTNPLYQTDELVLKLWRDLLGLSTDESWYSYRATVSKKEAYKNSMGKWRAVTKQNLKIERFKSPITFKPIVIGNNLVVYILINQQIVNELLQNNFKMLVEIKHKGLKYKDNGGFEYNDTLKSFDSSSLVLIFPDSFDFSEFLNYAFNIDIQNHVKIPSNPNSEIDGITNSLKKIYAELKEQSKSKQL